MHLATTTWGDGHRRALFLHGISSNAAGWWRLGPDLAALGFTVVAPDLRGHGETGRAADYLLESYRDDAGRVKKRTVATLGRLDQVGGELDSVISGLLKVAGREPLGAKPPPPSVSFESARALGDVWALTELWKELGFSDLRRVFRRTRHTTDVAGRLFI